MDTEAPLTLEQIRLERMRYLRELQREASQVKRGVAQYMNDPVAFINDCVDFRDGGLTAYQEDIIGNLPQYRREAVRGPHGLGKASCLSTPVPVPTGWSTIGDLRPGDDIYDESGKRCQVVAKSQVWDDDAYEVLFADGSSLVTHGNHEWSAIDVYTRPKGVSDWRDHYAMMRTVTTRQMMETLRSPGGQLRWRIPTARSLEMPAADLPVDPYLLGYWLGDGDSASARFTVHRGDWPALQAHVARAGYYHGAPRPESSSAYAVTISTQPVTRGGRQDRDSLSGRLRALGVLGNKHIPPMYLRASTEQRQELVRGLWDSDGYRQAGGSDEIALTNRRLAGDVAELLRTLGLVARIREARATLGGRDCGPVWRTSARFDFRPYHLARYEWEPRVAQSSRHTQRTIVSIRHVGKVPTQCIEVNSPSHLYLSGRGFIPSHNSAIAALTIWWFCLTRDAAGIDWKVVTTAGAWRQLIHYLWPEVRKWSQRLDWNKIRDRPLAPRELLSLHIRLQHGEAFAAACSNPALIEGCHADSLLFIYDESKSIPANTFDACEGAFSGTGECLALALSTPGEPSGRFYDICTRRPGYEDWRPRHVTLDEAIRARRINEDWASQRKRQWGEISALYQNRVLGEFYAGDEDAIIPLAWAEAAVERWHEWDEAGRPDTGEPHVLGVDPARMGEDKTAFAIRKGHVISELRTYAKEDTMAITGRVAGILDSDPEMTAMVDVIGVGAGVLDRLREMGKKAEPFTASAKTRRKDKTGELTFMNVRTAAWYGLREALDPSAGAVICLPDDEDLLGDLSAPHSKEPLSGGVLRMESKDEIRARIGRSTDRGDAVVQAFWRQAGSWADVYGVVECESCGRKFYKDRKACPQCGLPSGAAASMEEDDAWTQGRPQPQGEASYPAGDMFSFATVQSATQQASLAGMHKVFPNNGGVQW